MTTYGTREPSGAGEWMMNAVTRNPEGLLLVAAGAALLMRTGRGRLARGSRPEGSWSPGGQQHPRSRATETSLRPMAPIFPASTISAIAPTLSAIGTVLSHRCR